VVVAGADDPTPISRIKNKLPTFTRCKPSFNLYPDPAQNCLPIAKYQSPTGQV
jgi:hypothetical protein